MALSSVQHVVAGCTCGREVIRDKVLSESRSLELAKIYMLQQERKKGQFLSQR